MTNNPTIWIFSGAGSRFPSGVFNNKDMAIFWISKYKLTGILTNYPVEIGVYDWAIENDTFEVKKDHETSPDFIQQFTCAAQEHYHFEDGELD